MLRAVAALSVLAALALLFVPLPDAWLGRRTLPTMLLERYHTDEPLPTKGKEETVGLCEAQRCLTIYLSPWCPHCQSAKPMIRTLRAELAREGVPTTIIVGRDTRENSAAFASSFTDSVYLDSEGLFFDEAHLQGVPMFIMTDWEGHILQIAPDYTPEMAPKRAHLGLEKG